MGYDSAGMSLTEKWRNGILTDDEYFQLRREDRDRLLARATLVPGKYIQTRTNKICKMLKEDDADNVLVIGDNKNSRWMTRKYFVKWYKKHEES